MTRIALVPGTLALLPEYASLTDPVAELRAACAAAVAWLGDEVTVVGTDQGRRVGDALLAARGRSSGAGGPSYLVVANGSACRSEKAPGHLDPRAEGFDAALGEALRGADRDALCGVDQDLAGELLAATETLPDLADLVAGAGLESVDYDDDPYGVQYWVMRWVAEAEPGAGDAPGVRASGEALIRHLGRGR